MIDEEDEVTRILIGIDNDLRRMKHAFQNEYFDRFDPTDPKKTDYISGEIDGLERCIDLVRNARLYRR